MDLIIRSSFAPRFRNEALNAPGLTKIVSWLGSDTSRWEHFDLELTVWPPSRFPVCILAGAVRLRES